MEDVVGPFIHPTRSLIWRPGFGSRAERGRVNYAPSVSPCYARYYIVTRRGSFVFPSFQGQERQR